MKKEIVSVLLLIAIGLFLVEGASLSPTDVSIIVDGDAPEITILSPLNTTYNNATPLLVNYTIIDPTLDSTWYSLNSQSNITISSPFFFTDIPEGNYHLVIYANDSFNRLNFSEVYYAIDNSVVSCGDNICSPSESCSSCSLDCGSCPPPPKDDGGGGGGSSSGQSGNFEIIPQELNLFLKTGDIITRSITIKNIDSRTIDIKITPSIEIKDFVKLNVNGITLRNNQETTIPIEFSALETSIPELYLGKILFESGNFKKDISVTLEIESRESLFDVQVKVLDESIITYPGEEATAEIKITDIGDAGEVDVGIHSAIKDLQGNIITEKITTSKVDSELIFLEDLEIPKLINPGRYIFYTKIAYQGKSAIGSDTFNIEEKPAKNYLWIILLILIILIIIYTKNKKKIDKYFKSIMKNIEKK